MNLTMIRHLLIKDLSRSKVFILFYALLGVGAACVGLLGSETAFNVSMILVITCLIGVGLHPIFTLVLMERKENNFPFIMSLPVTYMDYTLAKILSVYIFALIPWLIVVLASTLIVLSMSGVPNGFIGPGWVVALEMFAAYSVALGVALVFSSEAAIVVAIVAGNIFVNFFMRGFFGLESVSKASNSPNFTWNDTLTTVVAIELLLMVAVIVLICIVQSRKKDLI